MKINTDTLVSITEANQNFSKVARLVDEKGSAVILKNNVPKYILIEYKNFEENEDASDDDIQVVSKRFMEENKEAYDVLSK